MFDDVFSCITSRHGELAKFWRGEAPAPKATLEAHCDLVYSMRLLDRQDQISETAIDAFVDIVSKTNLPGWSSVGPGPVASAHNCAYVFGALNLFPGPRAALYTRVLGHRTRIVDELVDPSTNLPSFPPLWAHHNWRVSHWIGGIPSILLSVARSGMAGSDLYASLFAECRAAIDSIVDPATGLLHVYDSDALQWAFRKAYAVRHDPLLGDLGGVAHLLWVDHAVGRPYTAVGVLEQLSGEALRSHQPFMEAVPYCLDFDIVQILRTAADQTCGDLSDARPRAERMMADLENFCAGNVPASYSLHKLTGALATYHECALLSGRDGSTFEGQPVDIIKEAHWL